VVLDVAALHWMPAVLRAGGRDVRLRAGRMGRLALEVADD